MKVFFIFLSLMAAQVSFASEASKSKVKCYNESVAAALKFVIETRESEFGSFKRFGVTEAGVSPKTDSPNNRYNVVMVGTQNTDKNAQEIYHTNEQILVKFTETYDNRCQINKVDLDVNLKK